MEMVKNDVRPFIKNPSEMDIWSNDYFCNWLIWYELSKSKVNFKDNHEKDMFNGSAEFCF